MGDTLEGVGNEIKPGVVEAILEELDRRGTRELIVLFSLGSQTDHLIKMRVGALGVYVVMADPHTVQQPHIHKLQDAGIDVKGIILSGGPASVHTRDDGVYFDARIFNMSIPVFGICLGFQLWAQHAGYLVEPASMPEFGRHSLEFYMGSSAATAMLFAAVPVGSQVVQSHHDHVVGGEDLQILASTDNTPVAAARYENLWGVQFHPEVTETDHGRQMLKNVCENIFGMRDFFKARDVSETKITELREQLGNKRAVIAFSGGTDSTVSLELLSRAVDFQPGRIRAVYIEGIDRADDERRAREYCAARPWIELVVISAREQYLEALEGLTDMREKRKAMRGVYLPILLEQCRDFGATYIVQGTLYTDISESGGGAQSGARKAQIKLHHNVNLDFEEIQELTPLDDQVKDTVRAMGEALGVPADTLYSQPFPGPGLVVMIEGEVTSEKLETARACDAIFIEMLRESGLYEQVWQACVFVLDSRVPVSKGDDAGMQQVIVLRAVTSTDGFTAEWARLSHEFIAAVSRRIPNEVPDIGRVLYDTTSKPPGTIVWG